MYASIIEADKGLVDEVLWNWGVGFEPNGGFETTTRTTSEIVVTPHPYYPCMSSEHGAQNEREMI